MHYFQGKYVLRAILSYFQISMAFMNQEINWYIEYDNKTFNIFNKPKYSKYIFKAAELFVNSIPHESPESVEVSEWVTALSNAVKDVVQLLYNFFYV